MFRICFLFVFASTIFGNQKVVLFNDTSAWYHWGCTGTSTALKEGIEKLGFEIVAVPINVTYALREVPPFDEFENRERFYRFCEENGDAVKAIQDSDAVVITGEGTIHDLRSGPRALLYLAHISREFFGKHVEIINHSAYPKDDPALSANFLDNFGPETDRMERELEQAREVYRSAYSKLDFVAIREPASRDEMKKIGIASTLSFDCLPVYIRDHYHRLKQVEKKTIVVGGSVAFSEEGTRQLCKYLETMSERGFQIKVLVGAAAYPAKDDQLFADFLKAHCNVKWELVEASSMEEWLDTINQATFLVSGRFHHSIAAFCLNTPFIALNSNTHKVHGVCSLVEHPEPLLFSDPRLLDQLLLQTDAILSSPVTNNQAKMDEICQLAERNFDGLISLMDLH